MCMKTQNDVPRVKLTPLKQLNVTTKSVDPCVTSKQGFVGISEGGWGVGKGAGFQLLEAAARRSREDSARERRRRASAPRAQPPQALPG